MTRLAGGDSSTAAAVNSSVSPKHFLLPLAGDDVSPMASQKSGGNKPGVIMPIPSRPVWW